MTGRRAGTWGRVLPSTHRTRTFYTMERKLPGSGRDAKETCAGPWPLPCGLIPRRLQGLRVASASGQATSGSGRIRLLTRGEKTRLGTRRGSAGRRPLDTPGGAHTEPSLVGSRPDHRVGGTVRSDSPNTCVLLRWPLGTGCPACLPLSEGCGAENPRLCSEETMRGWGFGVLIGLFHGMNEMYASRHERGLTLTQQSQGLEEKQGF